MTNLLTKELANELWATKSWAVPYLQALTRQDILELFQMLPAPAETELDGEYAGYPYYGHSHEEWQLAFTFLNTSYGTTVDGVERGYWLGKAFSPISGGTGEGYNVYLRGDNPVTRSSRFLTRIGASELDGRPVLLLEYAPFKNSSGDRGIVDEVRKVQDGLYPGLAFWNDPHDGQRTLIGPIFLAGPIHPWVGVDDVLAEPLRGGSPQN